MPKKNDIQLSLEEQERRRIARNKRDNAYQKEHGYAAQKRYQEAHKGSYYEPKIRIPYQNKDLLTDLLARENVSLTQLLISLVREKYGIDLQSQYTGDQEDN